MTFNNIPIQAQERADGACPALGSHRPFVLEIPSGPQSGIFQVNPAVSFSDCVTKPCRFEMCADGDLNTGQNIQLRLRVTSLATGVVGLASAPAANYGTPNIPDFWGGDLYHSGPSGRSRVGYFIQTVWPAGNQSKWPGPAVEIETGAVIKPPLKQPARPKVTNP